MERHLRPVGHTPAHRWSWRRCSAERCGQGTARRGRRRRRRSPSGPGTASSSRCRSTPRVCAARRTRPASASPRPSGSPAVAGTSTRGRHSHPGGTGSRRSQPDSRLLASTGENAGQGRRFAVGTGAPGGSRTHTGDPFKGRPCAPCSMALTCNSSVARSVRSQTSARIRHGDRRTVRVTATPCRRVVLPWRGARTQWYRLDQVDTLGGIARESRPLRGGRVGAGR